MLPEGWRNTIISEACELINGRGFKPHEWSRKGLPIIRIQNLNGSQEYNFYSGEFDKKILVQDGQLLFAWSGSKGTSFGPHIWNGPNGLLNYHTWKVLPKPSANILFLNQYFRYITSHIENKSHGASALVHTQKGEMENISILLPPLPEQKKIAAILSTWDCAIDGMEKLLANSQQQKKALMQQLLTGKKRLPGFTGEWKFTTLDSLTDQINNGLNYDSKTTSGLPVTRIETISLGKIDFSKIGYAPDNDKTRNFKLEYGDILYSHINSIDHIGKVSYYNHEKDLYHGMNLLNIRTNKKNSSCYLYYIFQSHIGKKFAITHAKSAVNQASISISDLKMFLLKMPPLPEQKAIAAVLSTADEEITALESDLTRLRQEKRALMQQLLTGKRRVTVD